MSIIKKVLEAADVTLDAYIEKSKASVKSNEKLENEPDRKGFIELDYPDGSQHGYRERRGLVGPGVLKNMAQKDSIVTSIIRTRLTQISAFSNPQKDKYSPGFVIIPRKPADLSHEDKIKLADPEIQGPDSEYEKLKFELEKKRMLLQKEQEENVEKIRKFVLHGGMPDSETDTTNKRFDFDKFLKLITYDRLVYNYVAIELIPTRGGRLHHFYPVSAGTIRYVSKASSQKFIEEMKPILAKKGVEYSEENIKPYKYVQVIRGRIVAAWTEDEMIFEPAIPTIDPEDNGYAVGELELLLHIITAHLYAEAHNRNFFTQGIGSKGILHIKGDNISRTQLEAFKRQWMNQVTNSKNAFRPPVIGMADEVRWVQLSQSNREMEFSDWNHYLIKIICAVYQIDPAEINFDISKLNTSTLNESNNEARLKMSRDKGLMPMLNYFENIINNHILRYWDPKLADEYEFKFVGLELETRIQEQDRLEKETKVWKTINEARIEMGFAPIEDGDIILNGAYTQYKQTKTQMMQADMTGAVDQSTGTEGGDMVPELEELNAELDALVGGDAKSDTAPSEKTEKSQPDVIEYFYDKEPK